VSFAFLALAPAERVLELAAVEKNPDESCQQEQAAGENAQRQRVEIYRRLQAVHDRTSPNA
jgi:hypothetical protein